MIKDYVAILSYNIICDSSIIFKPIYNNKIIFTLDLVMCILRKKYHIDSYNDINNTISLYDGEKNIIIPYLHSDYFFEYQDFQLINVLLDIYDIKSEEKYYCSGIYHINTYNFIINDLDDNIILDKISMSHNNFYISDNYVLYKLFISLNENDTYLIKSDYNDININVTISGVIEFFNKYKTQIKINEEL